MSQTMSTYKVVTNCGNVKDGFESEEKARDGADTHEALCEDCSKGSSKIVENVNREEKEEEAEEEGQSAQSESESEAKEPENAAELIAEKTDRPEEDFKPDDMDVPDFEDQEIVPGDMSVETDPLEILPEYMIDHVKDTPTLNKRGLSVLAYHYGVTVSDREILVSPHDSDWEYAIVETTVTNEDGNTFVGTGTAHVDRGDEREVILELAETRSYKRAVSFATGTGIVSYQELSGELE